MRVFYWCETHRSVTDSISERCHWDQTAGPRPGRGDCHIVEYRAMPKGEEDPGSTHPNRGAHQ